ncbi:hypothetical protein KKC94_05340 [Patescibacteria group bacterium]|nr:hypothetical protein [Patescibacteria group bacterium]
MKKTLAGILVLVAFMGVGCTAKDSLDQTSTDVSDNGSTVSTNATDEADALTDELDQIEIDEVETNSSLDELEELSF